MVLTIVERDDTGLLHRTSLDGGKRVRLDLYLRPEHHRH